MASHDMSIPVIDVHKLGDDEEYEKEEYKKLREACEEWGCFRIVNHNIPLALMLEMKTVARSLMDLPMEIKMRNANAIAGSGYITPNQTNPLYESLGLYDSGSLQAVHAFCAQLHVSSHQRETIEKYCEASNEVAMDIGRKIAKSVGLVDVEVFKDWPCRLRMIKYEFTPEFIGSTAAQTHSDSGFLTLLQDDEIVGGLEVMNKYGEFVAVNPWPGTLLVNLGDVAVVWSNGRFCNVKHRVQCKEANTRVSIGSFITGPRETAVEAHPEFIDSQHPRLYIPIVYQDYVKLRHSTDLKAGQTLQLVRATPDL